MKTLALIFFWVSCISAFGQNGYVILSNDSIIYGYVKTVTSIDGEPEVELWKTTKDRNPIRYKKYSLKEYAIKKDTFRIFRELEIFDDYYGRTEAKRIVGGKIHLYYAYNVIGFHFLYDPSFNYMSDRMYFEVHTPTISRTGSDFDKILSDFFKDDTFIYHYAAQFGNGRSLNIRKLKDLKELVLYYNTAYKK